MLQRYKIRQDNSNVKDVKKCFNGGVCYIYQAQERRLTKLIGKFNYSIESIGVTQFYEARVNNIAIDRAIGVPFNVLIDNQCIVQIGNIYYSIVRMQYKNANKPDWWNIVLARSDFNYVNEAE